MRILVYGFEPYGKYSENISKKVLAQLNRRRGQVVTKVFPVTFQKNEFEQAIRKLRPDTILGLGQHPRSKKMRIERRAKNQQGAKGSPLKPISGQGPAAINTTWKLQPDRTSRISYDAGRFVCNFSIYIIGMVAKKKNIPFAFLHIPRQYPVGKAARQVEKYIEQLL